VARESNRSVLRFELLQILLKRQIERLRVLRCHDDARVDLRLGQARQRTREVQDDLAVRMGDEDEVGVDPFGLRFRQLERNGCPGLRLRRLLVTESLQPSIDARAFLPKRRAAFPDGPGGSAIRAGRWALATLTTPNGKVKSRAQLRRVCAPSRPGTPG